MNKYNGENLDFFNNHIDEFNLLIVTSTPLEKKIFRTFLKPITPKSSIVKISKGKQTYYFGILGKYNCIHVACGDTGSVGREASLVTIQEAIGDCKPKIVLMVGIAFGKDKIKQKIGDVLVSERVTPYDPQRVGAKQIIDRGKSGPASSLLLNRFRNVDSWEFEIKKRKANIIIGEMLTGEKLLDNEDLKKYILERYPNAIGGEMEGAGLYAACDGKDIHWIMVKGICDFADGNKNKNKETHQIIAANSSCSLCEHIFNAPYSFEEIEVYPFDNPKKKINNNPLGDKQLTEKLFALNKKQIFDADK